MCFIKKSPAISISSAAKDPVERHQADASTTKHSIDDNKPSGFLQNIKTSPVGLEDVAKTGKKTLLGE